MATPRRLKELSSERVAAAIAADPRLIVPIGTSDAHGPHLALGCDTVLVQRLADDLSAEFSVLRAPTVEYGASVEAGHGTPAVGAVRKKTLHLLLTDLLASWERAGIREFILVTASADDAHREALATVVTAAARVRVVDTCSVPVHDLVSGPDAWRRGGEALTSLLLYLAPHLVDMRLAEDNTPDPGARRRSGWPWSQRRREVDPPKQPTAATAAIGEAVYHRVRTRIAARIFGPPGIE